jgi:antirestriction protein ArdC
VRVSPHCCPSARAERDREHGTAIIHAGRFIPYRDRSRAADRRRSHAQFLKRFMVFNTDHCENLPATDTALSRTSGPLGRAGAGVETTAHKEFDFGPLRLKLVGQAA